MARSQAEIQLGPSKNKKDKRNKNRKYGRNLTKCARYRNENRREKNKARKNARRLRRMN